MHPDILFITAHDTGRHFSCYGVPEAATESLDRLAADGIRFTNFFSAAPQCSPSRAAFMTGRYPHSTGVLGICSRAFGFDLLPEVRHLSQYLEGAGYRRYGVGEVHESLHPVRLFDEYQPMGANGITAGATEELVDAVRTLILEERPSDAPRYIQVGFREAHRPFVESGFSSHGINLPPWLADEAEARTELSQFQASLQKLDAGIGAILDAVEHSPRGADTLVIFVSDHGIPFPRAKHTLYEAGCQSAAIVRWPQRGWCGGREVTGLVSGVDLLPTVLEALEVAPDPGVQGSSVCGSLDGGAGVRRREVFTEQNYHVYLDASRAVRTDRFKLIANFSPGRSFFDSSQSWRPATRVAFIDDAARTLHPPLELYDLMADPLERESLVERVEHSAVLDDLRAKLLGWMTETDDPLLTGLPVPPALQRTLGMLKLLHGET